MRSPKDYSLSCSTRSTNNLERRTPFWYASAREGHYTHTCLRAAVACLRSRTAPVGTPATPPRCTALASHPMQCLPRRRRALRHGCESLRRSQTFENILASRSRSTCDPCTASYLTGDALKKMRASRGNRASALLRRQSGKSQSHTRTTF